MKKLRPLLAALLVLAAGVPRAALVTTLVVTTTEDEDGGNPAACSLREAVKAVNTRAPFGGCPAGNAFTDNVIQLDAATYALTRGQIYVEKELVILGKDRLAEQRAEEVDPLTGQKGRRARPDYRDSTGATGTRIQASAGSRLFMSSASLQLRDVVLEGSGNRVPASSVAGNGGVIFAASLLGLDNVIIIGGRVSGNSEAEGNGGALYLAGNSTSMSLTDVTIADSHASRTGGGLAMLCRADLNAPAGHTVTLTRVLLRDNSAAQGAGAMDICGNTGTTLTASTLSRNSSAAGAGAITYVQGSAVERGQLILNSITAAEQVGHTLALNGLANVQVTGSVLSGFDMPGRDTICHNPDPAVPVSANAAPTGTYNAVDNDGSCAALLNPSGNNVALPQGAARASVLVAMPALGSYYPATAGGAPYGLTDYYLPVAGSPLLDAGQDFGECVGSDQRAQERRSGDRCDIGAVERLVVTARDDKDGNQYKTDRIAAVDVLANDSFGESDTAGPYAFQPNTADDPATPGDESAPPVILVDDAGGRCVWTDASDEDYPGRLVVDNGGELTPEGAPIVCTYQVRDTQPATSTTVARVEIIIRNAPPVGVNDTYVRPVGTSTIEFNPLDNDNDAGDGKYGLVKRSSGSPAVITYGPETAWAEFYPIEIEERPQLGQVVGASTGLCPGSSAAPRTCLNPPLRYIASNPQSPFSDSFRYRVYDADGAASNSTAVTVLTDAPDPDRGGGAGSFDLLAGLALALLGLRRFRRL